LGSTFADAFTRNHAEGNGRKALKSDWLMPSLRGPQGRSNPSVVAASLFVSRTPAMTNRYEL
jgi:hypothetical protein